MGNALHQTVAVLLMSAHAAFAAPAPEETAVVPPDWASVQAPLPDKAQIRAAVTASIEEEKALALAQSKAAAIPKRYTASSQAEQEKYEKFAQSFDAAKVPGCLKSDGLKRQPTFIFGGLLALPFIAVAAIRGKCN